MSGSWTHYSGHRTSPEVHTSTGTQLPVSNALFGCICNKMFLIFVNSQWSLRVSYSSLPLARHKLVQNQLWRDNWGVRETALAADLIGFSRFTHSAKAALAADFQAQAPWKLLAQCLPILEHASGIVWKCKPLEQCKPLRFLQTPANPTNY